MKIIITLYCAGMITRKPLIPIHYTCKFFFSYFKLCLAELDLEPEEESLANPL